MGTYCYVASARRRATREERGGGILCRHAHSLLDLVYSSSAIFAILLCKLRTRTQRIQSMSTSRPSISTNFCTVDILCAIFSIQTELDESTGTPCCSSADTLSMSPSCAALSNAPVCTTTHRSISQYLILSSVFRFHLH